VTIDAATPNHDVDSRVREHRNEASRASFVERWNARQKFELRVDAG
jgi:hypothetical protein